jgi:anti-anti-sigma factor
MTPARTHIAANTDRRRHHAEIVLDCTYHLDREHGRCMVRLAGEVDLSNCTEVRDLLAIALADKPAHVDVDLSTLEFIDCSGIDAIAHATATVRRHGGTLRLREPKGAVLLILKVLDAANAVPWHLVEPPTGSYGQ